ncbi:MAG TPA: RNA 2',3'-cyclic phosphodiesterase [Candidatus Korarchaeota archaeon]|nr:RNA 2',3'-cyclic phosphodiesterase [Candidatus Korarchaeota archaeon]
MARIRTFIAVDLEDEEAIARIVQIQREILATGNDVKLVEPENLHVTLKFLGSVDEALIPEIGRVLSNPEMPPFRARLVGLGAFPNPTRPRVIWIGFEEGRREIAELMMWADARLRTLGFPKEAREPEPHLTIARVKRLRNRGSLRRLFTSLVSADVGIMEVSEIRVKKSILRPEGPIYETLISIPLPKSE